MKGVISLSIEDRLSRAVRIFLLIFLLSYIIFTVYAILIPKEGTKFTEFYLLGENGKAENYPSNFSINRPETVIIGIHNHEYRNIRYTIEIYAAETTFDTITNISQFKRMVFLERSHVMLTPDSRSLVSHKIAIPATGYNRLIFLLFKDETPPDTLFGIDRANNSYLKLDLAISSKND